MGVLDTLAEVRVFVDIKSWHLHKHQIDKRKRSLDENGVRYLLSMKMYLYAMKSLPAQLRTSEVTSRDIVWAYHSESERFLLEFATAAIGGKMHWKDARSLGIGYWLKSPELLVPYHRTHSE